MLGFRPSDEVKCEYFTGHPETTALKKKIVGSSDSKKSVLIAIIIITTKRSLSAIGQRFPNKQHFTYRNLQVSWCL